MPEARKHGMAEPVPPGDGGGLSCATPPEMCVPGATSSGFLRPSVHGPRPEKPTMSFELSADASVRPQPSFPPGSLPPLAVEIDATFSVAPTVMTFLAVPGELTVCGFEPALPAAKRITISWLPGAE